MAVLLSAKTVPGLSVAKPQYIRDEVRCGIVHLGIGAFHRAHQAVYTDQLLATGDTRWGITGASLRSSAVYDKLAPQDFLYTVNTRSAKQQSAQIIGSVLDVLVATHPDGLDRIIGQIAHPDTQVVTLTITEKGYCHDQHGELDRAHPDVIHDLADLHAARSAPAIIAAGLIQRITSGHDPLTILSCDNLAGNGVVTRNVVSAFVEQHSLETAQWMVENVSFPSSMVDRIVPQTSAADIAALESSMGYIDTGMVTCEPYSQWVIEDQFAGERPDWTVAGAEFVGDVRPFEQAKLRLLNASHSALAYLGLLAGYEYIHEAMAGPRLARFIRWVMDSEITPVVTCPDGMDLAGYKNAVLARFANSAVPYLTSQVASDGSQKLPQRILPTIADRLNQGVDSPGLSLVIAGWLSCLEVSAASAIVIDDPQAAPVADLTRLHSEPGARIQAIAQETVQFGDLAQDNRFLQTLTNALINIKRGQPGERGIIVEKPLITATG